MADKKKNKKTVNAKIRAGRTRVSLFPVFLAIVAVCCIVAGIQGYKVAYDKMFNRLSQDVEEEGEVQYSPNEIIKQAKENLIGADIDGVIKDIDYVKNTITFLNLKANESVVLTATDETVYPGTLSFEDYMIGDVVTFVYDKENNLTDIKKCKNAWTVSDVGLEVSKSSKRLTFGKSALSLEGKSYSYSDMCTVRYKNEYSSLEGIDSADFVTIQGYDTGNSNKAYSITIEKSHGTIKFINFGKIEQPTLNLNGKSIDLEKNQEMKITEGTHKIEVTSPSCENYIKEVIILPNEECIVDLSVMQIKSGVLKVDANVSGFKVFVDDVEYPVTEPILLDYGKYKLKVTKDDYDDFTTTVNIKEDVNTINVDMKPRSKYGSINANSNVEGTRVYVDGSYIGTTPVSHKLAVGNYTVVAKQDGYIEDSKSVIISSEGDVVNIVFDLTPVVSKYVETE